jgi:hypothetical protein
MYNKANGGGGGLYTSIRLFPLAILEPGALVLHVSPDTVLSLNEAVGLVMSGPSAGGGAFVGYATTFNPAVVRAVARNNTAPRDADVGTEPDTFTVLPTKVLGYIVRPDDLDAMLRVDLMVIGWAQRALPIAVDTRPARNRGYTGPIKSCFDAVTNAHPARKLVNTLSQLS